MKEETYAAEEPEVGNGFVEELSDFESVGWNAVGLWKVDDKGLRVVEAEQEFMA